MTQDAMDSIMSLRLRQLGEVGPLVARASQLCERVLASQGDAPDRDVLKLQHDLREWDAKWSEVES